jgi:hypothetical protein
LQHFHRRNFTTGLRHFGTSDRTLWSAAERFFVNGEEVERSSLRTKLLEHLSRRVVRAVYFEPDSDTVYMDDIYIDTIKGCGARVI